MLIPYFWAESRLQIKSPSKQVTVKRWGWSDISQEDAQAVADRRAEEAMSRILDGEDVRRREIKDAYGTEEGVPIREEVVSRHGNVAITRNSYGSLCLNAPNVFFADVDAQWQGALKIRPLGCLVIVLAGITAGVWQKSFLLGAGIVIGIPWLWSSANNWINQKRRPLAEARAKQENLVAIRAFAATHPQWHLRVYETPAGYQVQMAVPARASAPSAGVGGWLRGDCIPLRLLPFCGAAREQCGPPGCRSSPRASRQTLPVKLLATFGVNTTSSETPRSKPPRG
jgi:hypothetical protein